MSNDAAPNGAAPKKFMFDLSFDDATNVHRAPERKPVLMKPDQIDALKKENYDAGFDAGKVAGHDAQTAALAESVEKIARHLNAAMNDIATLQRDRDTQTRQLVMAIARKLLPDLAARHGLQEIESVIDGAIRDMGREPRLVIRVHESEFDAIDARVQEIAARRAYAGKLIVMADAGTAAGDCRVEWADGGVERNTQAVWTEVEKTVAPAQE
ncbi:MAG: hypothetical protein KGI37_05390 [Alphaproteobacteria bacterium]|nr:hypothetical protein [Alphaproteobacteria bacterium]